MGTTDVVRRWRGVMPRDIAAANGLIAAVGTAGTSPTSAEVRTVWTSHDGVTWMVATIDGSAQFSEGVFAVTGESAVVVFGPGEGGRSGSWIGHLAH